MTRPNTPKLASTAQGSHETANQPQTVSQRAKATKQRLEAAKTAKAAANVKALDKVISVIQTLREISPAMTLNQALVFLEVAKGCQGGLGGSVDSHARGVPNLEVRRRTGLEKDTLSPLIKSLSPFEYDRGNGKKLIGLDLLDLSESELDRRAKSLHLTEKGKETAGKIIFLTL